MVVSDYVTTTAQDTDERSIQQVRPTCDEKTAEGASGTCH